MAPEPASEANSRDKKPTSPHERTWSSVQNLSRDQRNSKVLWKGAVFASHLNVDREIASWASFGREVQRFRADVECPVPSSPSLDYSWLRGSEKDFESYRQRQSWPTVVFGSLSKVESRDSASLLLLTALIKPGISKQKHQILSQKSEGVKESSVPTSTQVFYVMHLYLSVLFI